MTAIDPADPKPPLGVGRILSQSFSILFRRFLLFFAIAFAVQLVTLVIVRFLFPTPELVTDPNDIFAVFGPSAILGILLGLVATSLTTGILVLAAYDAWLGNPSRPGAYVGAALAVIVPLIVLAVITNVAIGIGFVLLIVPGLYLAALWACVTPAIVAEGAGFGALGRSSELTRDYRWAIVGLLVLVFLIVIGVSFVLQAIVGAVYGASTFAPGPEQLALANSWGFQILNAVVSAITTAFLAITTAVLFARLKEIKEGVGYEDLGSVFD